MHHISPVDVVLPEMYLRDNTEDILGAYPLRGHGLSDLCHILAMCVLKAIIVILLLELVLPR